VDFGRAYTFMTADPRWISKILIAAAVSLVPILQFAVYGYALDVLKRVYEGSDVPMPEWDDFGDYFVRGLLVALGVFIWQLPILLLICPVIILGTITDSPVVWILGFACLVPIGIVFAALVGQVVAARYALKSEFSVMFEFNEIIAEARRGAGLLLLCILAYIVAGLAGAIAGIITCGIAFFFITPWLTLAQAHLLGQAYRRIRGNVLPVKAQAF
jgi:hypothetical protein